jgi:hypothetical protein
MWMKHQSKIENITYGAMWGLLFIAPVMSLYIRSAYDSDTGFDYKGLLFVWRQYIAYLIIFAIHNYILAPLLIYKQKRKLYLGLITVIIALFIVHECTSRPRRFDRDRGLHNGSRTPPGFVEKTGMHPQVPKRDKPWPDRRPPLIFGQHDVVASVILILMLGMNLAVKLYFKTRQDSKQMEELEKKNLEQQLEYLKYQINPHFFMNTLNNIHALVDIDPQKAQTTIVELSKMMRFVLYEGDKSGVPLNREFAFIRNYMTLMKLRYTDKVNITTDLPGSNIPDKQIPPLMLITFVENAFKHGVSYQRESFITVKAGIEGEKLRFECRNSKTETSKDKHGGVGLTNVKKRLNLIYGTDYTLNISNEADTYSVELTIPLI